MNAGLSTKEIWEQFGTRLEQFILKRVSDPETARDLLQDVFVKIHCKRHTLQDSARLESWVFQIARNALVDYYRRHRATVELSDTLSVAPEEEDDRELPRQLAPGLRAMIAALPEDYRQAIVLTAYQGLSQKALSERLGLSFSGAKSRVQRAREKLKQMLLECCHVELDRFGHIVDYAPRADCCEKCNCAA